MTPPLRCVAVVGVSFRRALVELRERLHLDRVQAGAVAVRLAGDEGEAVALSTCNRTELYLGHEDIEAATRRAFAELRRVSGLSESVLGAALYALSGERATAHLLSVAGGLDSMVPGEAQVLGQVRAAYGDALAAGATGPVLNRLFRQALRAGKRIRSETRLGERPGSVPAAAAALARQVFGELEGRRILIIGAGKMSELAAVNLVARGVESIFAGRTPARAEELARRFGGAAVGFDRIEEELVRADVVVASTRCPRLVLSAAQVAGALHGRGGRPLLLIDIAVPRDLDPAIGKLDGCFLYDIDDLAGVVDDGLGDRPVEIARAEAILAEEAARFEQWRRSLGAVPAIASLHRRAEEIRVAELARNESRLAALSAGERRAVETLTAQIVSKLLHVPTVRMKHADGAAYVGALEQLFGLDEAAL